MVGEMVCMLGGVRWIGTSDVPLLAMPTTCPLPWRHPLFHLRKPPFLGMSSYHLVNYRAVRHHTGAARNWLRGAPLLFSLAEPVRRSLFYLVCKGRGGDPHPLKHPSHPSLYAFPIPLPLPSYHYPSLSDNPIGLPLVVRRPSASLCRRCQKLDPSSLLRLRFRDGL